MSDSVSLNYRISEGEGPGSCCCYQFPNPKVAIAIGIICLIGAITTLVIGIGGPSWGLEGITATVQKGLIGAANGLNAIGLVLIILGIVSGAKDFCLEIFHEITRDDQETLASYRGKLIKRNGGARTALCDYSFIQEYAPEANREATLFYKDTLSVKENYDWGIMYGMAVGDAIGAPFEFLDYQSEGGYIGDAFNVAPDGYKDILRQSNRFNLEPGQWTDDTAMGLCLADVLIGHGGKLDEAQLQGAFIDWWHYGYNNAFTGDKKKGSVGLGGNISKSLSNSMKDSSFKRELTGAFPTKAGDEFTSGNGSLMRLGPVALVSSSEEEARRLGAQQSRVTHQGKEAAACAELMALILYKLLTCPDGIDRVAYFKQLFDDPTFFTCDVESVNILAQSGAKATNPKNGKAENWDWKSIDFGFNPDRLAAQPDYIGSYAMDALAMALHCVYTTHSFQEAVLKAATRGGDADTVGAITGQIAGALYGFGSIPSDWVKSVEQWDRGGEIATRAHLLHNIRKKNEPLIPLNSEEEEIVNLINGLSVT